MDGAEDMMVIEEPLEIYIDGNPRCLTMHLHGDEMQLALVYCFGEGIIDTLDSPGEQLQAGEWAPHRYKARPETENSSCDR